VLGPIQPFLLIHVFSALLWLPLIAIHGVAHIWQVPRGLADDWSSPRAASAPGRGVRLGVNLGALVSGVIAALFFQQG
jgi:hypothetical protein